MLIMMEAMPPEAMAGMDGPMMHHMPPEAMGGMGPMHMEMCPPDAMGGMGPMHMEMCPPDAASAMSPAQAEMMPGGPGPIVDMDGDGMPPPAWGDGAAAGGSPLDGMAPMGDPMGGTSNGR